MNCWHCDRPASGVCRFCGRGVCKDHAKEMAYVVSVVREADEQHKALAVSGALHCGECRPADRMVDLGRLENYGLALETISSDSSCGLESDTVSTSDSTRLATSCGFSTPFFASSI